MKRIDKVKLTLSRNWKFPGQERLSRWFRPSDDFSASIYNGITWLDDENIGIYTTADNYIECAILQTGTYEPELNKLIQISLKEGDVALDIGANIGLQSLRMAKKVGVAGKVIAFEPLPHIRKKLQKNLQLNRIEQVLVLPYALSEEDASLDYHINEKEWNQGSFSLGNRKTGSSFCTIDIKIADHLPEIIALNQLDLIKIDVEGYEFSVLKGLKETLIRFKPRIIFEYDSDYWSKRHHDIYSCIKYLNELGYQVYEISKIGCEPLKRIDLIASANLFCLIPSE